MFQMKKKSSEQINTNHCLDFAYACACERFPPHNWMLLRLRHRLHCFVHYPFHFVAVVIVVVDWNQNLFRNNIKEKKNKLKFI